MIRHSDKTVDAPARRAPPAGGIGGAWRLAIGLCLAIALSRGALSQDGPATSGLAVPRFASLRSDGIDVRTGPDKAQPVAWVFQLAGLPVEITGEIGIWRKIRDFDGTEGWVPNSVLSARRTALVAPWKKRVTLNLYGQASESSEIVANLEPGVLGNIRSCTGTWCRIFGTGFDGWEPQGNLWGVYPGERVN
jgi:SH3-like domain-containing protein